MSLKDAPQLQSGICETGFRWHYSPSPSKCGSVGVEANRYSTPPRSHVFKMRKREYVETVCDKKARDCCKEMDLSAFIFEIYVLT